jgi:hypothetical protein
LGHPLNAKAIDMDDLVHYIGNWTDLPVVNRTALSGLFTVNTEGWVPMRLPPPPPNATGRELLRRPPHNRHGSGQARSRTEATRGRSMRSTVYAQPPTDDHALLRAAQATRSFSATFPSGRVLFPTQWTGSGLRLEISAFPRSQSTEGHSGSDHELPVMSL